MVVVEIEEAALEFVLACVGAVALVWGTGDEGVEIREVAGIGEEVASEGGGTEPVGPHNLIVLEADELLLRTVEEPASLLACTWVFPFPYQASSFAAAVN